MSIEFNLTSDGSSEEPSSSSNMLDDFGNSEEMQLTDEQREKINYLDTWADKNQNKLFDEVIKYWISAQKHIEDHELTIHELKTALSGDLQGMNASFENVMLDAADRNKKHREQLEELKKKHKSEVGQLKLSLGISDEGRKEFKKQLEECESKLKECEKDLNKRDWELENLQKTYEETVERLQKNEKITDDLIKDLSEGASPDIEAFRAQYKEAVAEKEQVKSELVESRGEIRELREDLRSLRATKAREKRKKDINEATGWEFIRIEANEVFGEGLVEEIMNLHNDLVKYGKRLKKYEDKNDQERRLRTLKRVESLLRFIQNTKEGKLPTGWPNFQEKIKKYPTNTSYQQAQLVSKYYKIQERSKKKQMNTVKEVQKVLDLLKYEIRKNRSKSVASSSSGTSDDVGVLIGANGDEDTSPLSPIPAASSTSTPTTSQRFHSARSLSFDTPQVSPVDFVRQTPAGFRDNTNMADISEIFVDMESKSDVKPLQKITFGMNSKNTAGSGVSLEIDLSSPFSKISRSTFKITKGELTYDNPKNPIYALQLQMSSLADVDQESLRSMPMNYSLGFGGGGNKMRDYRSGEYAHLSGENLPTSVKGVVRFSEDGERAFISINESKYPEITFDKPSGGHFELNDLDTEKQQLTFMTGLYRATPHIAIYNADFQDRNALVSRELEYFTYDLRPNAIKASLSLDLVIKDGGPTRITPICHIQNMTDTRYGPIDSVTINHRPKNKPSDVDRDQMQRMQFSNRNLKRYVASKEASSSSSSSNYNTYSTDDIAHRMPTAMSETLSSLSSLPARSIINIPLKSTTMIALSENMIMSFHTFVGKKSGSIPDKIYSNQRLLMNPVYMFGQDTPNNTEFFDRLYDIENARVTLVGGKVLRGRFMGSSRVNEKFIPIDVENDQPAVLISNYRKSETKDSHQVDFDVAYTHLLDSRDPATVELLFVFDFPKIKNINPADNRTRNVPIDRNAGGRFSDPMDIDTSTRFYRDEVDDQKHSMLMMKKIPGQTLETNKTYKFSMTVVFAKPSDRN